MGERIQQDHRFRDIPVIMISSLDDVDNVVRCIELGADDYLPKPTNRTLLRARINAGLSGKRLYDLERSGFATSSRGSCPSRSSPASTSTSGSAVSGARRR